MTLYETEALNGAFSTSTLNALTYLKGNITNYKENPHTLLLAATGVAATETWELTISNL